jgi:hypothetical protein
MGKRCVAAMVALSLSAGSAWARDADDDAKARNRASEIDTEHIFGFVEGGDIGARGDLELEKESALRFGKRAGSYAAVSTLFDLKYVPREHMLISPGVLLSYHGISGVPGLADRQQIAFQGLWFEAKYQLIDRETSPFGLTLFASPRWTRIDETSGERADQYSAEFTLALDREIVPARIFGALNLIYEPEVSRSRETGEQDREANLGAGVALSGQVRPGVFIGAEARYLRSHEGLIPNALKGEAFFLGPTFYTKLTANSFMSVAWNAQVAGRAVGEPGALDLANFERHQVRFRLGIEF